MAKNETQNSESRYHKGWIPIKDTVWKVETLKDGEFVTLGEITVKGSLVSAEMDAHQSIKGYEPYDIAQHVANEKFPNANPIIVSQVYHKRTRKHAQTQH